VKAEVIAKLLTVQIPLPPYSDFIDCLPRLAAVAELVRRADSKILCPRGLAGVDSAADKTRHQTFL